MAAVRDRGQVQEQDVLRVEGAVGGFASGHAVDVEEVELMNWRVGVQVARLWSF